MTTKNIQQAMRLARRYGAGKAAQAMGYTAEDILLWAKQTCTALPTPPRIASRKALPQRVPRRSEKRVCPGCRWALSAADGVASCYWQACPYVSTKTVVRMVWQ